MASTSNTTAFIAGVLVPTVAYIFLNRNGGKAKKIEVIDEGDDGDWDDSDSDDYHAPPPLNGSNPSASWSLMDAPYKMVLCVNTSLGMGKGE